jgi:uncharacterized C2H2 Zn-finger protein
MKVTHRCPITQRIESLFEIPLQNYSPKSKEILFKCPKCSDIFTVKSEVYRRNSPRRSSVMMREKERQRVSLSHSTTDCKKKK